VRSGGLRAVLVAEAALARIEADNPRLGAFTDVTRERALREAAAADGKVAAGEDPGPLAGVPYAVKNLFDIEGLPTRAGSRINPRPSAGRARRRAARRPQHGRVRL
jgi:1-carboxybiuret hydrolase